MQKICLVVAGLYIQLLSAFSQSMPAGDTSQYKSRKLKLEEVNLVSSYYHQNGKNAAVTGGIGSEKLTDIANGIDLKFIKYDKKYRLHTLTAELGVDTYTSASSDMIDSKANSSASSHDIRVYPAVSWSMENEKTGNTIGLNASASKEFDYLSFGLGTSFSKKSQDKSREVGLKAQVYLDQVSLIAPVELRTINTSEGRSDHDYATTSRNTFSGSFSLSQIVNQRFQFMLLLDLAYQQGFLSLPFHRVYFNNNSLKAESLPGTRFKIPVGIRANYFAGDKIIFRTYYRFYDDDWGLIAHTAELETVVKITPFLSVSPFYRYYTQTAVKYFAPYLVHQVTDTYYTSNYDLSQFNSQFFGAGIHFAPLNGIFGNPHIGMIEFRYGHYTRSNSLNSDIITMNLKFK